MTNSESLKMLSSITELPPVRRDLLSEVQTDAVSSVFYDSAIISKGWLDPESPKTEAIFKNMVESVTSGRASLSEAVSTADAELNLLLNK